MKKLYLFLTLFSIFSIVNAQFVDSFESYTTGAFLAASSPKWTTWSNAPGGPEDVKITTADAHSGTKSVYFESTASGGGPQDVVLPFDSVYTKGHLVFDVWMKIESGKGAYFNVQGDATIGSTWAINLYFTHTGSLTVQDGSNNTKATTTYPPNTWFKLTLDVDFFTNNWKLFLDGVQKGTWSNGVNRAASIDFFPYNSTANGGNNISGFYIDDVSVNYTPYVIPPRNGALTSVTYNPRLVNQQLKPSIAVQNIGTDTLKSFDIVMKYGNNTVTESFSSLSIPHQSSAVLKMQTAVTAALDTMVAYITNVNGQGTDMDPSNDTVRLIVDQLVTPQPDKLVIAEMVTGTGYGWAPKGIVTLASMQESFSGYILPINIHNGDPMEDTAYFNAISSKVSQFPSGMVNRVQTQTIDPSFFEDPFVTAIAQPATAILSNTSRFINDRSNLEVEVVVDFKTAATGNYGLVLVVTEDSVRGTSSDYAQKNNYSSAAFNIPLEGAGMNWQQQADPVPAADMVYNHVARYIAPDYYGVYGIFPTSINAGDTFHHTFKLEIDSTLDLSKFNIISMLLAQDGKIDNASVSDLSAAQVVVDSTGVGVAELTGTVKTKVYPNPSNGNAIVEVHLMNRSSIELTITDITGRTILSEEYNFNTGLNKIPLNVKDYSEGIYLINIKAGDYNYLEKLILKR